jgi:Xaa-Pro aminopeptidase
MDRIKKVQKSLHGYKVDALLVTNPVDLRYLLGISLSAGSLIILPDEAYLMVDGRYFETCQSLAAIQVRKQGQTPIADLLGKARYVGFGADTQTYWQYLQLKEELSSFELVPLFKPVEMIRAVKDEAEIACIKKSCQLAMEGLQFLCSKIEVGISEKELARELEVFWIVHGAQKLAFDPIIAFGKNSSKPHWRASEARLDRDDPILVDIGTVVDGYASDITRMVSFSKKMSGVMQEIFYVVQEAKRAAICACRPNMTAADLYDVAMSVIEKAGYKEAFLHSLGHGIGLETHEHPILKRAINSPVLQSGMVITIEPGIYLPGVGGVRLEDVVQITENGGISLTPMADLVEL